MQGGVFAEGVDYPGDMLIGALVVGPALPSFTISSVRLLREYYQKNYGNGFDYAYTFPAMAKVVQSAGRVIRSPDDRGLIVLLDQKIHSSRLLHQNRCRAIGIKGSYRKSCFRKACY